MKVRITYHAIDRASQRLVNKWLKERKAQEGLYSWLYRLAREVAKKIVNNNTIIIARFRGIHFIFRKKGKNFVLITVY